MSHKIILSFALLAALCGMCHAQSFNIDLDTFFGTEQTGNGAPSAAFGAAANQPGVWNRTDAGGPVFPTTLIGLDGSPSAVTLIASGGLGSTGGYNNPSFSGDFRLLMGDYVWL